VLRSVRMLWSVVKRCEILWSVMDCDGYGVCVVESWEVLCSVVESCAMLLSVVECPGVL